MQKLILILLVIISLLCPSLQAQTTNNDNDEWYPFYFPEKLDPDSPLNIGKLVLDPPAGKHGFCKAKDGHFYFEDGTRAKFWGTNLCFNACFPTKEQAEMLATRIAYFGFNAVRLHHMDYYFEPKGIFEDVCPAYKDPQMKKTGVLSKKQLDRLDYLIYQLKIRGIYINMNLLVSRHFTEADGVEFAKELGMAAKPVSLFDPALIELQKKYAQDLLTHYNPYTKLRYCDDPVVALVEITNENSIMAYWQWNNLNGTMFGIKNKGIPTYYSQALDHLWNEWLRKKYHSPAIVISSWGNDTTPAFTPSIIVLAPLNKWKIEEHKNAKLSKEVSSNTATLNITRTTQIPWHLQFKTEVDIEKDQNYIFNFTAQSSKPTTIGLICQQASPPWHDIGLSGTIDLTSNPQDFSIPFTATQDNPAAKLAFLLGYEQTSIQLTNISLSLVSGLPLVAQKHDTFFSFPRPLHKLRLFYNKTIIKDITSFYTDLTHDYFDQMLLTLRDKIGIKIPIAGIGGNIIQENTSAMRNCDFNDLHTYWDHPRFPNKQWDKNNFTIHDKSMLQDPSMGMIGSINKYHFERTKPYTITEWNHCYPNQYAYESPILMALNARDNDWDALFQFAFSHGWDIVPELDTIQSYFDILPNAQQLVLCAIGSYIYLTPYRTLYSIQNGVVQFSNNLLTGYLGALNNSPIRILNQALTPLNNGALIFISSTNGGKPVLLNIGRIKNKNSLWNYNKFIWGTKPTHLQKVNLKEELDIHTTEILP